MRGQRSRLHSLLAGQMKLSQHLNSPKGNYHCGCIAAETVGACSPTLSRTSTLGGEKPWVDLWLPVVDKLLTFLTDKKTDIGTKLALSNTVRLQVV